MSRFRFYCIFTLVPLAFFLVFSACQRTVEEEVIKPVQSMYGQKDAAAGQTAISNVRTVRAALMRYPAVSPSNQYPGDMEIYDYESLREVLADEYLPPDMGELMWDPAYGISYRSDGYTFTFEVRALDREGTVITATPSGVTKN